MKILVQKFGGTSVATHEARQLVCEKISKAISDGYKLVVVVSAMGRKGQPYATDTLITVAKESNPALNKRELDSIMCCGEMIAAVVMAATLQSTGIDAVMMTGGQAGITTDDNFGNSRILSIDTSVILNMLAHNKIPVICGFQGITQQGAFTTLGRGGSDTTAAALGSALNADKVEIFTDVDGIMTADPNVVKNAQILDTITYAEISQLAHQGAKVIHPRAIEIAMHKNIPLVVRSTFSDAPGTLISASNNHEGAICAGIIDRIATGVTYMKQLSQFSVQLKRSETKTDVRQIFQALADKQINVDLVNILPNEVLFTVSTDDTTGAKRRLTELGHDLQIQPDCAKISVVGGGMKDVPGVMASFVEALDEKNIPVLQTADSQTTISALIQGQYLTEAVIALHDKFGLSQSCKST